jgi:hypothetical protein
MNAADIPARCLFEQNPYEFATHRMDMLTELFELLWAGTITAMPCMLSQYNVGDRVEIFERTIERTPQGVREYRTGRELYAWVTHVGYVNQGALVTFKFASRTYPMRNEGDVHRSPVFYPMVR